MIADDYYFHGSATNQWIRVLWLYWIYEVNESDREGATGKFCNFAIPKNVLLLTTQHPLISLFYPNLRICSIKYVVENKVESSATCGLMNRRSNKMRTCLSILIQRKEDLLHCVFSISSECLFYSNMKPTNKFINNLKFNSTNQADFPVYKQNGRSSIHNKSWWISLHKQKLKFFAHLHKKMSLQQLLQLNQFRWLGYVKDDIRIGTFSYRNKSDPSRIQLCQFKHNKQLRTITPPDENSKSILWHLPMSEKNAVAADTLWLFGCINSCMPIGKTPLFHSDINFCITPSLPQSALKMGWKKTWMGNLIVRLLGDSFYLFRRLLEANCFWESVSHGVNGWTVSVLIKSWRMDGCNSIGACSCMVISSAVSVMSYVGGSTVCGTNAFSPICWLLQL